MLREKKRNKRFSRGQGLEGAQSRDARALSLSLPTHGGRRMEGSGAGGAKPCAISSSWRGPARWHARCYGRAGA